MWLCSSSLEFGGCGSSLQILDREDFGLFVGGSS